MSSTDNDFHCECDHCGRFFPETLETSAFCDKTCERLSELGPALQEARETLAQQIKFSNKMVEDLRRTLLRRLLLPKIQEVTNLVGAPLRVDWGGAGFGDTNDPRYKVEAFDDYLDLVAEIFENEEVEFEPGAQEEERGEEDLEICRRAFPVLEWVKMTSMPRYYRGYLGDWGYLDACSGKGGTWSLGLCYKNELTSISERSWEGLEKGLEWLKIRLRPLLELPLPLEELLSLEKLFSSQEGESRPNETEPLGN